MILSLTKHTSLGALVVLLACSACQAARLSAPSVRDTQKKVTDFEPPSFYNGKEGPEFRMETSGESYDERTYEPATWATTKLTDTKLDAAFKEGSKRLENYRKGGNANGTKFDLTVPTFVILKPAATGRSLESDFVVHSFVPRDLQDSPPEPDEEEVELKESPERKVYVKTFGGYGFEDAVIEQTFDFMDELKEAGVSTDGMSVAFAQYDGPLKILGRHNEIWMWSEVAPTVSKCHKAKKAATVATSEDDDKWERPTWCYKKDCPRFVVKETSTDAELRQYSPSKWLIANFTDVTYAKAIEQAAKELKDYRDGHNNMQKKVGETSPSSFAVFYPANGAQPSVKAQYSILSYLPYELQEQEAPKPSSEKVSIIKVPGGLVWVKVFGGFAKEVDIIKEASQFREELQKDEKEVDPDHFAFAGFDPVTILLNRHNEIHMFVKGQAPSAKASSWVRQQVQQVEQLRRNAAFP